MKSDLIQKLRHLIARMLSIIKFSYIIFFTLSFSAVAKEKLYWLTPDFPPVFILEGPFKNQGFADKSTMIIQSYLKDWEHVKIVANMDRQGEIIKNKNNLYCHGSLLKSPSQEARFYMSIPISIIPPPGIVALKDNKSKFPIKDGKSSLKKVLSKKSLSFVLINDRPYGEDIDSIIDKNKGLKHGKFIHTQNISSSSIRMVLYKRFDYTIEYSTLATYESALLKMDKDILFIPLVEQPKNYTWHVGCVKTENGKRLINKINSIWTKEFNNRLFMNNFKQWLSPSIHDDIERAHHQLYKNIK